MIRNAVQQFQQVPQYHNWNGRNVYNHQEYDQEYDEEYDEDDHYEEEYEQMDDNVRQFDWMDNPRTFCSRNQTLISLTYSFRYPCTSSRVYQPNDRNTYLRVLRSTTWLVGRLAVSFVACATTRGVDVLWKAVQEIRGFR